MNARAQSQASLSSTPAFTPAPVNLVQRKCACGGSAGLSGECDECRKEKLVGEGASLIQPKLKISQPNDKYEQEADRVADEVMRMPFPAMHRQAMDRQEAVERLKTKPLANQITPLVQRETIAEVDDKEKVVALQRNAAMEEQNEEGILQAKGGATQAPIVTNSTETAIQSMRQSSGHPLDLGTRTFMEQCFGHDFSNVRVHTETKASAVAQTVSARAFTYGRDVVFGRGQYMPHSHEGRRLLAHELTHSIQQRSSKQTQVQRAPTANAKARVPQRRLSTAMISIPLYKGPRESLALLVAQTFPEKLTYKQALQLVKEIKKSSESFSIDEIGKVTEEKFTKVLEPKGQFNINRETYDLLAVQVSKVVGLDVTEVSQRLDQTLVSLTATSAAPITQAIDDVDEESQDAKFISAEKIAVIHALSAGISKFVNAGEIKLSGKQDEDVAQSVRTLAKLTLKKYFGLNMQLAETHVDELLFHVPTVEQLQVSGISTLEVVADVGKIQEFLLMMETSPGKPLINEDEIPGKGMPSANTIEEASLLDSIGEFSELAVEAITAVPKASVGVAIGTVKTTVGKAAAKQTLSALKRAGRIAYRDARRAFRKLQPGYAKRLGVPKNGNVHHAIELVVLKKYPGVFSARELNLFSNMRGIPEKFNDKMHLSGFRTFWNEAYEFIDNVVKERKLAPGTPEYNKFVREVIDRYYRRIDDGFGHLFTDYGKVLE